MSDADYIHQDYVNLPAAAVELLKANGYDLTLAVDDKENPPATDFTTTLLWQPSAAFLAKRLRTRLVEELMTIDGIGVRKAWSLLAGVDHEHAMSTNVVFLVREWNRLCAIADGVAEGMEELQERSGFNQWVYENALGGIRMPAPYARRAFTKKELQNVRVWFMERTWQ